MTPFAGKEKQLLCRTKNERTIGANKEVHSRKSYFDRLRAILKSAFLPGIDGEQNEEGRKIADEGI